MAWRIEFDPGAVADLKRLDRDMQKRVLRYRLGDLVRVALPSKSHE